MNPFVSGIQEFPVSQQRVFSPVITHQVNKPTIQSQTNTKGNTVIDAGTLKGILAQKEVLPGFDGPPAQSATHYANGASDGGPVNGRNVGADTHHSGSHGANGGNAASSGDGNSGRGSQRIPSSRNGGSSDGNNSSRQSSRNGNSGRGSQGNPNSHGGGPPDGNDSPGRPNGNGTPFGGPPPNGTPFGGQPPGRPPGSGFPSSGPPSPPREPPGSTNDRRREYQSNRCFRNVIRLVKEGIDLHQRIRSELSECFRKTRENDDLQILSILNTILPGIVEETGILRE